MCEQGEFLARQHRKAGDYAWLNPYCTNIVRLSSSQIRSLLRAHSLQEEVRDSRTSYFGCGGNDIRSQVSTGMPMDGPWAVLQGTYRAWPLRDLC